QPDVRELEPDGGTQNPFDRLVRGAVQQLLIMDKKPLPARRIMDGQRIVIHHPPHPERLLEVDLSAIDPDFVAMSLLDDTGCTRFGMAKDAHYRSIGRHSPPCRDGVTETWVLEAEGLA